MKATFKARLATALARQRSLIVMLGMLIASVLVARSLSDELRPRLEATFNLAEPRSVEDLTQQSVARDYGYAWDKLATALRSNAPELLNAYFVSPAKSEFTRAIESQKSAGIRCDYLNPSHKLEAIFYSPEGDVMELHDTAEFDLQVTADGEVIHHEHVVLHYVVLMTPAADHWAIRQLQAVSKF